MATTRSERAESTARGRALSAISDPRLVEVARLDHEVTGVSVSEDGRIFVNFPRWTEDVEVSVAELLPDGSLRPYPDTRWNEWRNAKKNALSPGDRWVCVQSVVADGRGSLWVIDPAAPATAFLVQGGPKLVRIDLTSDAVVQTIAFDEQIAREVRTSTTCASARMVATPTSPIRARGARW